MKDIPKISKRLRQYFKEQGRIGGKVGASKLTPEQRTERARKAGKNRWKNKSKVI